jgi:hypothetical protein
MDEQDLRLIRLVTRHFLDLRGLSNVVIACLAVVTGLGWLLTQSFGDTLAVLVVAYVCALSALQRTHTYYAERYGRVVIETPSRRVEMAFVMLSTIFLAPSDHPSSAWPLWIISAGYPAWLVIDGWPFRAHHLASVAAMVTAAFISLRADSYFNGIAQGLVLVGVTEVVCGFADHALLERAMTVFRDRASGALAAPRNQERA